MYLLLGDSLDPCCLSVRTALEALNYSARIIANPLAPPSNFAWRLDNQQSASQLQWNKQSPLGDHQIKGVFVRSISSVDPAGWQTEDLMYAQAETQAALLAWLWSLTCPVVNRYPSTIWYRPKASQLHWQRQLRQCGLPTLETLVTNVAQEAVHFRQRLTREGVAGAVYGPLTGDTHYLVTDQEDWRGLAALQRCAPVSLTYPHGAAQFVCLAGEQVAWEGEPPPEASLLEPALRRFGEALGLVFVEFVLARTAQGISIIAVEPYPHFEHFGDIARKQIISGIVQVLTTNVGQRRQVASQS